MNNKLLHISAVPTVDTNIYGSGDLLGTKMSWDISALRDAGGLILDTVLIADAAKQVANVDLLLFGSNPASTTFTDNAAVAIHADDLAKIIAGVSLTTHISFNANSITVGRALGITIPFPPGNVGLIYGCLISRATPTYAAATNLRVTLGLRAA